MTALRTAAQQALEAMRCAVPTGKITLADWYKSITALKAALVEPVQQGCDHCNQPLHAAVKCRVCGRVTESSPQPVAWMHTDPDKPRVRFLEWRENEPGYRGAWIKTPLYTAPPPCPNCASLESQNSGLDQNLCEMEHALNEADLIMEEVSDETAAAWRKRWGHLWARK